MSKVDPIIANVIKEYIELTKKDCYKLVKVPDEVPGVFDNKFGGIPYIPKGESVPLDSNGNSMALLLQLNMKDIELDGYPNNGILEIFTAEIDTPQEFKIVVFPEGLEVDTNINFPTDGEYYVVQPVKIEAVKTVNSMPAQEYRCAEIFNSLLVKYGKEPIMNLWDLENDELELLWSSTLSDCATIGGYGDFTQDDPREKNDTRTECFLKIDSLFGPEIDIGDSGILFLLCSKDQIINRQFDDMYMDFDCC